jgi:hypothetical protein
MHEHHEDRPHPESVVLDIGGDIGAVILYTDADLRGREFEIGLRSTPDQHTHVEVLERIVDGASIFAATYYGLREGEYVLRSEDGSVLDEVMVKGGEVATVDWRGSRPSELEHELPTASH